MDFTDGFVLGFVAGAIAWPLGLFAAFVATRRTRAEAPAVTPRRRE